MPTVFERNVISCLITFKKLHYLGYLGYLIVFICYAKSGTLQSLVNDQSVNARLRSSLVSIDEDSAPIVVDG